MSRQPAIEASNIVKRFRASRRAENITILKDVSFTLPRRKGLAAIGANGSGKTTLLKILATLYLPDEGSCQILGYDLVKDARELRKKIAFVSPNLEFQKKLTLKETLEFFARVQQVDMANSMDFIEFMGLDEKLNDRTETFSEGQKAITRLAIAIMKDAKLLLLDEVTATLDINRKEDVIDYLESYCRDRSLVLIDHSARVVERLCHRVLMLSDGQVQKYVRVKDLLDEMPFKYNVVMTPKRRLTNRECQAIWPDYTRFGGLIRFFAHSEDEIRTIAARILRFRDYINFDISTVSLQDLAMSWTSSEKK
ncbi:MAG: ABC transporter ATP-binding protein [Candidatus Heimdallarchaeota archaeon]|nr:ABC transporter ATP-binding protein [Candidatus Heimdallarchaeota archaeon]MCK5049689.1 ABC transporter ATP-binding protein [Candidatus Heimdallarchaeota archaeon]